MTLKSTFVSFLLLPLISILLIAAALWLNKTNTALRNNNLIVFILVSSLLLALPGLLSLTGIDFIPVYYHLTQIVYLFLGILYAKKTAVYFSSGEKVFDKIMILLVSVVILCLGSFLFSLLFDFLGDLDYGLMASTCTYTLLIPVFFQWAYQALLSIPSEIYKIWSFDPLFQEPSFTADTIDKIVVLELELSKHIDDSEYVKVKAKAPLNFNFGEWFQLFLHDHNMKYSESPIHYNYPDGSMFGWIFYTKPSVIKGKKYIDFEKTIAENELTDDYITLVCKRVDIVSS